MINGRSPRVLMLALDAAEPDLMERWTDDGSLPNLAALRRTGAYGRLRSSAEWLVGSPWPTFFTGTEPSEHGFYHYLAWDPERMAHARPTSASLPIHPFWRDLSRRHGLRTIAFDIPLTYQPEPYGGIEVNGYATHEVLVPPGSHPSELWREIVTRFGPPPMEAEDYALETAQDLLITRDRLGEATRKVGDVGSWLMRRNEWDLCMIGLCSPHRGGHKLWDDTGMDGPVPEDLREAYDDALRQVYIECDEAIGRLVDEAGPDATVMVFSVHGMGANTCRTELLGEMLRRVLADARPGAGRLRDEVRGEGVFDMLRDLVPGPVRHAVKQRLPLKLQDWLTAFWRLRSVEWATTSAVSLVADLQGYVRINLKGRESRGIIEPADVDALCERIEVGLSSFVDADTGHSVVRDVTRTDVRYANGPNRDKLPDLLVRWVDEPVSATRRLESAMFGAIDWPTPGKNVTGRSGNHRGTGFVVARGAGFGAGERLESGDIKDLAPTVYALLHREWPGHMVGRPLCGAAETPGNGSAASSA